MKTSICFIVIALAGQAGATPNDTAPIEQAMKDELARSIEKLALPGIAAPYFLSYGMWDMRSARVEASFGVLVASGDYPKRFVDIDLHVGDYAFDNSNFADSYGRRQSITLPVDSDYGAVRYSLWLATDAAYKSATETLERKKAVAKQESKSADEAASFSKEAPSHVAVEPQIVAPDLAKLEDLAKQLSAVFRRNPDAYQGRVAIDEVHGQSYFISSEGSVSSQPETFVHLVVECSTQAEDGMPVSDSINVIAARLDQLPATAELVARVEKLSAELSAIRKAPIVDDYGGPVLFTGLAAGQVTRALLGENFSGTPAPKGDRPGARSIGESDFVGKIGQHILPPGVSIIDDPTATQFAKFPLVGHYRFDEEGIPPQKVSLVENGTLKRFLMSRIPRKGFEHSTGHGRSTPLAPIRAHPANLIVTSSKALSDRDILTRALAAAKEQDLKYVIVVEKLGGGSFEDFDPSTFAGDSAALPKAIVMKRVYLDGKQELVRGGTFGAVPVRALKDLLAIGTSSAPYSYLGSGLGAHFDMVFPTQNGFSVSIVAPPLLFRDVDVKKPIGAQKKPPIAPRP